MKIENHNPRKPKGARWQSHYQVATCDRARDLTDPKHAWRILWVDTLRKARAVAIEQIKSGAAAVDIGRPWQTGVSAGIVCCASYTRTIDVVCRKFSDGQVIALFCHTADKRAPGMVDSYMQQGQHAPAARNLGQTLPLATADESAPLLGELARIYSPLRVHPVQRLKA